MGSENDIIFSEGALHTIEITIPDEYDLTDKLVKVQVRRNPSQPIILEFSTEDPEGNFVVTGQKIDWVIPGSLSVGKSGRWQWQLVAWTNEIDPALSDSFSFIIEPSTAKIN